VEPWVGSHTLMEIAAPAMTAGVALLLHVPCPQGRYGIVADWPAVATTSVVRGRAIETATTNVLAQGRDDWDRQRGRERAGTRPAPTPRQRGPKRGHSACSVSPLTGAQDPKGYRNPSGLEECLAFGLCIDTTKTDVFKAVGGRIEATVGHADGAPCV